MSVKKSVSGKTAARGRQLSVVVVEVVVVVVVVVAPVCSWGSEHDQSMGSVMNRYFERDIIGSYFVS
jgi:hypothetical protein